VTQLYMLDTNICSFIMGERPIELLARLQACVDAQERIVVSAITYAEMRFGAVSKKASPKHATLVSAFVARLDGVLPWDAAAVDETTKIRVELAKLRTPIGDNDSAIAGHAISAGAVVVTNYVREFMRVPNLRYEDWTVSGV
jgi:tRNA(fMet)-specific endonuclease VapC